MARAVTPHSTRAATSGHSKDKSTSQGIQPKVGRRNYPKNCGSPYLVRRIQGAQLSAKVESLGSHGVYTCTTVIANRSLSPLRAGRRHELLSTMKGTPKKSGRPAYHIKLALRHAHATGREKRHARTPTNTSTAMHGARTAALGGML